jgi:hypothetical protein
LLSKPFSSNSPSKRDAISGCSFVCAVALRQHGSPNELASFSKRKIKVHFAYDQDEPEIEGDAGEVARAGRIAISVCGTASLGQRECWPYRYRELRYGDRVTSAFVETDAGMQSYRIVMLGY